MKGVQITRKVRLALCFIVLIMNVIPLICAESEVITTIILINRQAELVDVDTEGEILKRHVAIPDYFSSGRSHKSSLKKSLSLIKDYGSVDYTLPGSSDLSQEVLQEFMSQPIKKDDNNYSSTEVRFNKNLSKEQSNINHLQPRQLWAGYESKERLIRKKARSKNLSFLDHFFPERKPYHGKQHQVSLERFMVYTFPRNIYT